MAAVSTRVHVIFHPLKGLDFAVVFHVAGAIVDPTNAGVQAIIAAINSVTSAVAIEISLSVVHENAGSVTIGAVYVSEDKAQFRGVDDDGQAHTYKIPGLITTILNADKETIDLTNADVIVYTAAVTANALGPGGVAVTAVTEGHRTENRKKLKR